ncbi:MAG: hypothetical protein COT89_01885 [Candidatus Colwellbacteria bacterium CG10_big_fil_rev_8_21_14_0_10_42_22]|uniref:Reverse transcriptase domain-containing protein n=1 Tax=Candidatus Colwellbacteria bacterium CG10_big_fil_rev_8_21_14_0_10_42_22 TaxID=1974540 RepID=A0A2H0VFY0_9BACT|nr:MAG: hypothetical protein COT89_01885 [Candidatus Colwellbacteria bacterium CG10_big_fil_rev_8_21_14_0_10_42_22]
MRMKFIHTFEDIIGLENLLEAWGEFVKGKRGKHDVQEFSLHLMDNIFKLHAELLHHTYRHGGYQAFNICDPKPRNIHKARVRDRLLHHAIHRKLYPFFDKIFIQDSYSCRVDKGTHKALNRFRNFAYKVSKNNTRACWVLKCDIRKFFANINHTTLMKILQKYIRDKDIIWLLEEVIESFSVGRIDVGLPLGNLTSQLFVNVYMNEFDQFAKHRLKARYYIRYADDFVLLSENKELLRKQINLIGIFLKEKLSLELHPHKVSIKSLASGIDFLGWVHFSDHRVLRTQTKRRVIRRVRAHPTPETFNSYLGLLRHGNTYKIRLGIQRTFILSGGVPNNVDEDLSGA